MTTEDQRPIDLGLFAKTWIGLLILFNAWNIYRTAMRIQDLVSHSDPRWKGDLSWALPTGIALSVVMILTLATVLLTRRRLGIYAAGAVAIAAAAINLRLGLPPRTVLTGLIGIAVLVGLLIPRWSALR